MQLPATADVRKHGKRCILVGDTAQSLYDFNGAVDAMSDWPAQHNLVLSQSWRFGAAIAGAANQLLARLDAPLRFRGNPRTASRLTEQIEWDPSSSGAILCRTSDFLPRLEVGGFTGRGYAASSRASPARRMLRAALMSASPFQPQPGLVQEYTFLSRASGSMLPQT